MTNEEFIQSISLDGEIWKDVVGYEGIYMVSSLGRVTILSKNKVFKDGRIRKYPPRLLVANTKNKDGYCVSILTKNNKTKYLLTHRLVAKAFLPNPYNLPIVEHLDCNKNNNTVFNLRWCTQKINMNNPITIQNCKNVIRRRNNPNISTKIVQLLNGEVVNIYPSMREAERAGFNQGRIWLVCKNKAKTHNGFVWKTLTDYEKFINKSKNS